MIFVAFLVAVFCLLKGLKPERQQVSQPPAPTEAKDDQATVDFSEPAPGTVVFDMKYRGLSGAKDELRYNAYWGYGQREEETPFIREVRKKGGEFSTVYNSHFKRAEWSAVEVKDNKAVAFYFDLDADGKLSENEKILPIEDTESGSSNRTEFVTPDFTMTTQDGHQIQFRTLLQVAFYGQSSRPQCMWSPSCVLEGTSTINGEPAKLILFGSGFTGTFDKFGRCSYALQTDEEQSGRLSRHTLSSIINLEGQFYNLKFQGSYEQGQSVRAVLEEYTGDKGELAVALSAQTNLKTKLNGAGITGGEDNTINFHLPHNQATLPTGTYKISSGNITYGTETDDQWRVDFKEGPEVVINADQTSRVELGKPELSISAVDEKKRYNSDAEEKTVYSKGTNVYLSRIIKGKTGELYGRFSERQNNPGRYTDIQPELRIIDAEGKQVAASKIEYG
ncbi:hypothetical protein ACFL5Z_11355 [Planctomycetota bacterium]